MKKTGVLTMSDAVLGRLGASRHLLVDLALVVALSWVIALFSRISFQLP